MGILIIDKPGGITSHGVVAVARRTLGTRKIGHAGTLDPMATGVLVLGVGQATRLLGHLALRDKEYLATIRLGASTSTDDAEGDIEACADPGRLAAVTDADIAHAMAAHVGSIQQVPSSISAIKIDGQRAYKRVRAGEEVTLAAREVTVNSFELLDVVRGSDFIDVRVRVECSTGTYIRALARDLGRDLGVGGHLTALRRTRVGPFTDATAHGLDSWAVEGDPASAILPLAEVAGAAFTCRVVNAGQSADITHGRRIPWLVPEQVDESAVNDQDVVALVDENGRLLALAEERDGLASYLCVFVSSSAPA